MLERLPIDDLIPEIRSSLAGKRHLVIVSPPGSGKTTRVPPELVEDGRVVLLQPRRVAARSLARRIAEERNWQLGKKIGWQIRLDRNFTSATELLVCTEGILTARLQKDPLISEFRTVILDEFHERSIHADLALALTKQAARARDDLRIVVMSATIDPGPIVEFLGGFSSCGVIESEGALHPVAVEYRPDSGVAHAVDQALSATRGDLLVFLPGMREIERTKNELAVSSDIEVAILHGSISPADQDHAITPGARRKVILSTNIAETSLTVEGVEAVIDSGLHKIIRYDDDSGIDRLVTERIPRDSADQRAGRAGRLRPGLAVRLWDERDILPARREPEIHRTDLAPVLLDVLRWGDDPRSFAWFEAPSIERVDSALRLLHDMGAVELSDPPRLTEVGATMQRLPVPPRLGRILIEARGSRSARLACAAVAEGRTDVRADVASDSDLLHLADSPEERRI
ncbi:MAG: helicase-related protein, partial [Thermoanaerobaculia bacterium]|nr:helicase-related protein [Thermoanaerobaculia bacterium]